MPTIIEKAIDTGELGLLGGPPAVRTPDGDLFDWPIITTEDEDAVLEVLRRRAMSGTDVTSQFEREFAAWQGVPFALGCTSGTASLHSAMYGCGVGVGDEIICPSITYWASATPCFSLGASVVFADIDPETLCLDPADIERHLSDRTKAIVVVHYASHPAAMDPIMEIAQRHGIKVIEDVSHAQGGLYRGRKLGTIGDVGAMSLMTGKSFAVGEAGMLVTANRTIYERALAFGHYDKYTPALETESLRPFAGLPLGGCKYRMHQLSSAVGRVQLKYYDERCAEIRRAVNYFWNQLEGLPGIRPHRVEPGSGSNNAGFYSALGHYDTRELGGLSLSRFVAAVRAEGSHCRAGCNLPLHTHPQLNDCDIYGHGKPTRLANATRDLRQPAGSLPVSEGINGKVFAIPVFKHFRPDVIAEHAAAFRRVVLGHEALLQGDTAQEAITGNVGLTIKR